MSDMDNSEVIAAMEPPLKRLSEVIDGYNATERRLDTVDRPHVARILPFKKKPKPGSPG
jgi:hypothetical protein